MYTVVMMITIEAARVAQKVRLKEIYIVEAKVSRETRRLFIPIVLSLEHKCSTEIISWGGGEGEDEDHLPDAIKKLPDGPLKQAAIMGSWRIFIFSSFVILGLPLLKTKCRINPS